MKIRGAKKVHYDSGPNMTPLVDVVMVILIFMMLAGTFGGTEWFLTSNLPYSPKGGGGAPLPAGFVPDQPLEIKVDSPLPDRFVARIEGYRAEDAATLRGVLTKMRDKLAAAGNPPEKVQIIISPARNVKYKFLVDVYQTALQANFQKVGFAPAR